MMRLYRGCGTRRLTSTTIVFCILVDTTSPTFSFFNAFLASVSAMLLLLPRQFPLAQDGVHTRPVFPHLANLLQAVHLPHRHLKMKTKHLLVHFLQLVLYFVLVKIANVL